MFTDSQNKTESYGNYLNAAGWKNEVINGAQEQSVRLDVLEKLIKFKCRTLITTDLMARGIDIENINLIINLDLPHDCFTYLHRIGRAGRFGSYGIAITLINGEDELEKFEKMLMDIGGKGLNVMRYPESSYDFWDFTKQNDLESILETSIAETDDEITVVSETMLNNLALLNITRKLVDIPDQTADKEAFNLDALLDDYEQTTIGNEYKKKEDTFFLSKPEGTKLQESTESPKIEHRHVVFNRKIEDIDIENTSCSSSSSSESSESSATSESEYESEAEDVILTDHQTEPAEKAPKTVVNPYSDQVTANYSQWQNIYQYQLANIQKYVDISKK